MSTGDRPPSRNELVDPEADQGDGDWLKENFAGKTYADAIRLFESRQAANIGDNFWYMSAQALDYYLPAVLEYLRSEASRGDGDFAFCIMGALSYRNTHHKLPLETRRKIHMIASYLMTDLKKFGSTLSDPSEELNEMLWGADPGSSSESKR